MRKTPASAAAITLLTSLLVSDLGAAVDGAVKLAPQWNCQPIGAPMAAWRARIGELSGPLTVSGNTVLAAGATNDNGVIVALDKTGQHLWTAKHTRLAEWVHDMGQGIRSRPTVDGRRVYYVSNRGELMCVARHSQTNAAVIWKFDMPAQLGVFKREAGDVGNPICSPLVVGDLVYCVTGHGRVRETDARNRLAPSFIAVDKFTGKLVWSSSAPGTNIIYAQWSSPVLARVNGREQIIFPGGDGLLYGFEPRSGALLWKLDCNEPGLKDWRDSGSLNDLRTWKNFFVGSPVVHRDMLFVGLNKDFETTATAPLLAINLAAEGAPQIQWKFNSTNFGSTYTSAAMHDGIVFVVSDSCVLFALDAASGRELWQSRLAHEARSFYASPAISRGRVYVSDESGVSIFAASRRKQCFGHYELGAIYPSTPVVAHGRLYVAADGEVWALELPGSPLLNKLRLGLQRLRGK